MGERIAIIGSGISGLGCAWFLHRNHDIAVYEADDRVGGHSHTISISEDDREVKMDTGFMVYNEVTYPHLTKLFRHLDVPTEPTRMSFSVQHQPSGIEWNGDGLNQLFGQRKNLFNPGHWRFLKQLNRFNKEAVAALDDPQWQSTSLEEYVEKRNYGNDFLERYLIPMSGAVWSTPPERMLNFPATTLLRFWHNHGFLGLDTHHPWITVKGGSTEYVKRLLKLFGDKVYTNCPVKSVERREDSILICSESRGKESYDKVILACHAPTSLSLLDPPTDLEKDILTPFAYQRNDIRVHSDQSIMPKITRCWASWNYRTPHKGHPTTHYWMNSLQGVSDEKFYFVSLNSENLLSENNSIHRKLEYEHPLFDLFTKQAQLRIPELNSANKNNRTFFAGAWTRYGFHEDGLLSAVNVCESILGGDPWKLK